MTKQLMITISAEHAFNILDGKKTLELRTWIPKGYMGWVNAYVTKNKPYLIRAENYDGGWINKNKGPYLLLETLVQNYHVEILNGKVAFRFWFDEYDTLTYEDFWDRHDYIANDGEVGWEVDSDYIKLFCLDYQDILDYGFREKPHRHQVDLFAWHIKKLEVFDTPKKLGEFQNYVGKVDDTPEWAITSSWQIFHRPLEKGPQKMQWVCVKKSEKDRS